MFLGRFRGGELAHDVPFVEHYDPVGEREDLIELGRHQQDPYAKIALGDVATARPLLERALSIGEQQKLTSDLVPVRAALAALKP